MIRKSSVDELLSESEELIKAIHEVYLKAGNSESIVEVARPRVKSCLEHLRSCLDYIAQDLSEATASPKTPRLVYFPYGKDKKIFADQIKKNLPDLCDEFRRKIESVQPHVSGDRWLLHLCRVTNDHKHDQLQEQVRRNSTESLTHLGGGAVAVDETSVVRMSGAIINGETMPDGYELSAKKPVSELQKGHSVPVERKYEWVKFVIKGSDIDVLALLNESHQKISALAQDIYGA